MRTRGDTWRDPEAFAAQVAAVFAQASEWREQDLVKKLARGRPLSKSFHRWFSAFKHEGWIRRLDGGRVGAEMREGRMRVNPKGFGFVVSPDHPGDDVFVPERWMGGARHDDRVKVWVRPNWDGPGPEGRVVSIVARSTDRVVGRLERARRGWRVMPADQRLPTVEVPNPAPGRDRDLVVARIVDWPRDPRLPVRGEVDTVLGQPDDPGIEVTMLQASRHLPLAFPEAVLQAAEALPNKVRAADLKGRLDLRRAFVVTIDGSDAKDLDDAISLERTAKGYRLGVHIADVSHYVTEGSPLDVEARERGTSVYLVDRVVPMLPERLSNGIASLNPGVPRLTVSAFVDVNEQGEVVGASFRQSVIKTRYRLTYEGVNALLRGETEDKEGLMPFLTLARELRDLRFRFRQKRGAVDFDLPEAKVVLDPLGRPIDIRLRTRGTAESIIEECMLLANEAVAGELARHHLPGLFRIHEEPVAEKLEQFRELIGAMGHRLPKVVTPKSLQNLLGRVKGTPEERVVSSALLRSMRQARYAEENLGHFGLASKEYTHFTSPIRRYPDLWVHRVLTTFWRGEVDTETIRRWQQQIGEVAAHTSLREREAMEAERESVLIKQMEFMADKLGERYDGIVSGVTAFGIFVELPNLVEGLVRVEDLPKDGWAFDPVHYRLTGRTTGMSYRIGDQVTVEVARVDQALRRLDLILAGPSLKAPRKAEPPRQKARPHRRPGPKRTPRPAKKLSG